MSDDESAMNRRNRLASRYVSRRLLPPGELGEWINTLPSPDELDQHHSVVSASRGLVWMEPTIDPLPPPLPHSHRSGTCFENESEEMRTACVDSLQEMLDADAVVHEVRHQRQGYHTDLVYAEVDPDAVAKRAALSPSAEPLHDPAQRFHVWWHIHEEGPLPSEEAVRNGRYADPSTNREHINWLLDNGYLARTTMDHLTAVVPDEIATLHAVELKRRNWRTALEQADRANRCDEANEWLRQPHSERHGYADYRWVALDAGTIDTALAHREAFENCGVGLLAIAEDGTVVTHIDADYAPRGRYTRDRAHVESRVWEQIDIPETLAATSVDPSPMQRSRGIETTTLEEFA